MTNEEDYRKFVAEIMEKLSDIPWEERVSVGCPWPESRFDLSLLEDEEPE